MKMMLLLATFLSAVGLPAPAFAQDTTDISGNWKLDGYYGNSPICKIKQEGDILHGACSGLNAEGALIGTIAGWDVRWRWQITGKEVRVYHFTGYLGPDDLMVGLLELYETKPDIDLSRRPVAGARGELSHRDLYFLHSAGVPKLTPQEIAAGYVVRQGPDGKWRGVYDRVARRKTFLAKVSAEPVVDKRTPHVSKTVTLGE